ncbi:MAG TPA: hypothetical protein V6D48_25990 [Oculatellaceae cyanobacterium]
MQPNRRRRILLQGTIKEDTNEQAYNMVMQMAQGKMSKAELSSYFEQVVRGGWG